MRFVVGLPLAGSVLVAGLLLTPANSGVGVAVNEAHADIYCANGWNTTVSAGYSGMLNALRLQNQCGETVQFFWVEYGADGQGHARSRFVGAGERVDVPSQNRGEMSYIDDCLDTDADCIRAARAEARDAALQ